MEVRWGCSRVLKILQQIETAPIWEKSCGIWGLGVPSTMVAVECPIVIYLYISDQFELWNQGLVPQDGASHRCKKCQNHRSSMARCKTRPQQNYKIWYPSYSSHRIPIHFKHFPCFFIFFHCHAGDYARRSCARRFENIKRWKNMKKRARRRRARPLLL